MATAFRTNFRAGLKTVLDNYMASNPTLLSHTYDHPPSEPRTPCAWVEKGVTERLQHTAGVRIRRLSGTVRVANRMISEEQMVDEQDALVDGLLDAFTANADAAGASTLIEPVAVDDAEIPVGDAVYAGFTLTIEGTIQEGRL